MSIEICSVILQVELASKKRDIMNSFYSQCAKNTEIFITSWHFFVHMCKIPKHYYSCTITSCPILEYFSVSGYSVVFHTSCVSICSISHRVFPTASCFTSTYEDITSPGPSHAHIITITSGRNFHTLFSTNWQFQADRELLNIFTVPNAIIQIHSSEHLCSPEELASVHIMQCLLKIYTMSPLQNRCVAGVCWCRRLAQLCNEYSLNRSSQWLWLYANVSRYIKY